ncbi:MAG TPA: GTP-binding protein [Acidobacteriaceae bacterium]|jgi:Ni2+-binding GTPase involved in maturation of urease and hydrogenase
MKPTIVFVGGFLGAGKTTLILAAARELKQRGMRCAAILNDQSDALVDTKLATLHELPNGEVTEGCFCCRLSDLTAQLEAMLAYAPDVIFAEPVGSCTDIAATVLHPLMQDGIYRLAPFTVLVDPHRADEFVRADAADDIAFLFQKQLQEADLVCVTKSDLHARPEPALANMRQISARSGQGVAAWLDEVLAGELSAQKNVLDIDYERYAQAEAALAWLNLRAVFEARAPISPAMLLGPWLDGIDRSLTNAAIHIVHLKAMAQAPTGYVKAGMCANGQEADVEGMLDASPSQRNEITLNIRALAEPEIMAALVQRELQQLDGEFIESTMRCFRPAAPQPERRVLGEQIVSRA